MMRGLDARPIRLALYYPLVDGGLREIDAAHRQLTNSGKLSRF